MGLDIKAYQQVKLIDECDTEDWETKHNWENTTHVHPSYADGTHWPEHLKGGNITPNGVYEYAESFGFRAGSYSGYNRWRETLSQLFIGVDPRTIWESPGTYKDRPFYHLVNFSDCEGIIVGDAATKLAADFEKFKEKAHQYSDAWFVATYDNFYKAFNMAIKGGFVYFH